VALAAERHKLPAGRYINVRNIKAHLVERRTSVVIGIDFFFQAWNHGESTLPVSEAAFRRGLVGFPNMTDVAESHKHKSGHAVLIVGWDDTVEAPLIGPDGKPLSGPSGQPLTEKGFYVVKNSWGTGAFGVDGDHGAGFGLLSQRYVETYGSAFVSDPPGPTDAAPPVHLSTSSSTNSAAGVMSTITVPDVGPISSMSITVDASYVGNLQLKLAHNDQTETLSYNWTGSAAPHTMNQTVALPDFASADRGGPWTLTVQDTGHHVALRSFTIDIH
jgi:hypothetical protein